MTEEESPITQTAGGTFEEQHTGSHWILASIIMTLIDELIFYLFYSICLPDVNINTVAEQSTDNEEDTNI